MNGEPRQYPHRVIKLVAKFAGMFWHAGRPLGRTTRARACHHGGKAVGFDMGLDCIVTCLQCGLVSNCGATLMQIDSDEDWVPDWLCKRRQA